MNEINIKEIEKEINLIKTEYNDKLNELKLRYKKYLNLYAIIPYGKYKDRLGKITSVSIDDYGNIRVIIQPKRKRKDYRNSDELLWDDCGARTYWKLKDVIKLFKE